MKHAYFMLPLEPSRTQRTAQTMCRRNVRPTALAWPGESTITCPECARRVRALHAELKHTLATLQGIFGADESRAKAEANLSRAASVMPTNIDALAMLPQPSKRRWPFQAAKARRAAVRHHTNGYLSKTYTIYRCINSGAWGYAIETLAPPFDEDWFTDLSECIAAAKRTIDHQLLKEQDHEH